MRRLFPNINARARFQPASRVVFARISLTWAIALAACSVAGAQTGPPTLFVEVVPSLETFTETFTGTDLQVLANAAFTPSTGGGSLAASGSTGQGGAAALKADVAFIGHTVSATMSGTLDYSSVTFPSGRNLQEGTIASAQVIIFVLGPPGTPFSYDYTARGSTSGASDLPIVLSSFGAFSSANVNITQPPFQLDSENGSPLPANGTTSGHVTGVTIDEVTEKFGATYSLAGDLQLDAGAEAVSLGGGTLSAEGVFSASFTISGLSCELTKSGGDGQTVGKLTQVPTALQVTACPGTPITFQIAKTPEGDDEASLSTAMPGSSTPVASTTVTIDPATGIASVPFTTGEGIGQYGVTASCPGCASVVFTENALCPALTVSALAQSGSSAPWDPEHYDQLPVLTPDTNTIGHKGCGLTALAMALNFAGPLKGRFDPWLPGANPTPPPTGGDLNMLLTRAGAYLDAAPASRIGGVDWTAAVQAAREGLSLKYKPLTPAVDSDKNLEDAIEAVEKPLCAGYPVIVAVRSLSKPQTYPGHFVLITGEVINQDGSKAFLINDPAQKSTVLGNSDAQADLFYSNGARFATSTNPLGALIGDPEFLTRGFVTDPIDFSAIAVAVDAVGTLSVMDPSGNQTSLDPVNGPVAQNIPNSAASNDEIDDDVLPISGNPIDTVDIDTPAGGTYQISLVGTLTSSFTMSTTTVASDGSLQVVSFPGLTSPGLTTQYQFAYSTTPGVSSVPTLVPGSQGAVPTSQVSVTVSSLAYSPGSQTFIGRVSLTNRSTRAVSGPLEVVFTNLPAGVTLVKASGMFDGTMPYVTVPDAAPNRPAFSLAPGQSITVPIRLQNRDGVPLNSTPLLNSTPVLYSGPLGG